MTSIDNIKLEIDKNSNYYQIIRALLMKKFINNNYLKIIITRSIELNLSISPDIDYLRMYIKNRGHLNNYQDNNKILADQNLTIICRQCQKEIIKITESSHALFKLLNENISEYTINKRKKEYKFNSYSYHKVLEKINNKHHLISSILLHFKKNHRTAYNIEKEQIEKTIQQNHESEFNNPIPSQNCPKCGGIKTMEPKPHKYVENDEYCYYICSQCKHRINYK